MYRGVFYRGFYREIKKKEKAEVTPYTRVTRLSNLFNDINDLSALSLVILAIQDLSLVTKVRLYRVPRRQLFRYFSSEFHPLQQDRRSIAHVYTSEIP